VAALSRNGPPNTKIGKATIDQSNDSAAFTFKTTGGSQAKASAGFQCALVKKRTHFKSCTSPKRYKHLKQGNYTFKVRAFDSAGTDKTPAKKKFSID
jgi:hypothetical protein